MQALDERGALGAREVGQHVHAKDAVKAANIDWLGQVHGSESDQTAQPRLDQQVRAITRAVAAGSIVCESVVCRAVARAVRRAVARTVRVSVLQTFSRAVSSRVGASDLREAGANRRG